MKQPTHTTVVLAILREQDDFLTWKKILQILPGERKNQVIAALHHLRKYHAADVIVAPDGTGWWYALPTEQDSRLRTVKERTPEARPRRPRKQKVKPVQGESK